jgi:hypothetical protein
VAVLLVLRFVVGVAFSMYFTTDQNLLKLRLGVGPEVGVPATTVISVTSVTTATTEVA